MRLARSWVCVWLSQRRRNCCTTSSDARALPALHGDDESSALASIKIVASCARQAFFGMDGGYAMKLTCMVLVSRALKAVRWLDFFRASGL